MKEQRVYMYIKLITRLLLSAATVALISGCGDSSGDGGGDSIEDNDIVVSVRIDDTTGFVNLGSAVQSGHIGNNNGTEINPSEGIYTYKGDVYTSGSMKDGYLKKYQVEGNTLTKVGEINTGEFTIPTSYTFVSDTKAYIALAGAGKMFIINPTTFEKTGEIDLSQYAIGEGDINPEPADAVVRDGKLYVALTQIDSFQTYACRGVASLVIIDIATDTVDKHITDDRTCGSGLLSPNNGMVIDENGDIYVNNTASFGYVAGFEAGFLRIKNGESDFDPDFFFSINQMTTDVEGGLSTYAYNHTYAENGDIYTTVFVPALTSNPPNYAEDRNYVPYKLNMHNMSAQKVDLPATSGWSSYVFMYNNAPMYVLSTKNNGNGLFRIGDTSPYVSVEGSPVWMRTLN